MNYRLSAISHLELYLILINSFDDDKSMAKHRGKIILRDLGRYCRAQQLDPIRSFFRSQQITNYNWQPLMNEQECGLHYLF